MILYTDELLKQDIIMSTAATPTAKTWIKYPCDPPNNEIMTLESLDIALKICSIQIDKNILKRVIDIVTLLREKPNATLIDITTLRNEWNNEIKFTT